MNKQNCSVRGTKRPQNVYASLQSAPLVMVLWAMSESEVAGPSFFDSESVIGNAYKKMLHSFAFPRLCHYPQAMIFN